jgi:glycosyltransferase involved in cell wall biosynthesis
VRGDSSEKDLSFICFGGVDWWYHSHAHLDPQLAVRFAKMGTTLFINSIVMLKFNFHEGKRFFRKLVRKIRSLFTGLKKTEKGFWVYSPFTLPVHHIWWAKPLNDLLLSFQVRYVARKLGIYNPVVLVACPVACDVAIRMKKRRLIYQRADRFEEADGVDVNTIVKCDRRLKAVSDLTIYVNRKLFEEESIRCKNPFFLDHGVDFEMFASAERSPIVPHDIANIPKPIVGYFGAISRHSVDITLMEKVADLLPKLSFVYVGTTYEDYPDLIAKKNVWLLGQKPYEQIPHYGKNFDVAILPWVKNSWTEAANPIKVKEYLALGKPFVSTPVFTQIQEYLDVVYIADTPKEFAQCIRRALSENCIERIAARRRRVEKDTWDSKVRLVIEGLFGNSNDFQR